MTSSQPAGGPSAAPGTGSNTGASAATGSASGAAPGIGAAPTAHTPIAVLPNPISIKISGKPELMARVSSLLPAGLTLEQASTRCPVVEVLSPGTAGGRVHFAAVVSAWYDCNNCGRQF